MSLLERDVVVGRGREVGTALGAGTRRHVLVATGGAAEAALAVGATSEELDGLGDDLHRLALAAVLRLPLAPIEAPVHCNRSALREVLRAALGLIAEDGDAEVVRLVDPLAGLVPAAAVHRDAQAADRCAARRVPELGIARQVADEDDPVDVRCHYSSSPPVVVSAEVSVSSTSSSTAAGTSAGTGTACGALLAAAGGGVSSRGALVREPSMCLVAMWRMTPSSIFNTRLISSSVAGSDSKTTRW